MRYELWRQDDHGGRFLVGDYAERRQAEAVLARLTRHPHKQMYWITVGTLPSAPVDGPEVS